MWHKYADQQAYKNALDVFDDRLAMVTSLSASDLTQSPGETLIIADDLIAEIDQVADFLLELFSGFATCKLK